MEQEDSFLQQDPALNWSEYTDNYICKNHSEPLIKECDGWSGEQAISQLLQLYTNRHAVRNNCVFEIGC